MQADTLTDNPSANTAGMETASGETWLTASFGTDASGYTLSDVRLLLDSTDNGTAAVSIYSDGLLSPGSLLGTLTSSASVSSTLSPGTFSTSGLSLAANATYWVVDSSHAVASYNIILDLSSTSTCSAAGDPGSGSGAPPVGGPSAGTPPAGGPPSGAPPISAS